VMLGGELPPAEIHLEPEIGEHRKHHRRIRERKPGHRWRSREGEARLSPARRSR
jgi:hypothetical protein